MSAQDEETTLARLLGDATVTTPATLNAGLRWVVATIRKELAEQPAPLGQEWATVSQIATKYGKTRAAVQKWVERLMELGKIRVRVPLSGANDKGDAMYSLIDLDTAFQENAERLGK